MSNNLVSVLQGNGFRQNMSMIRRRRSPSESMLRHTLPMESFLDTIVGRRGGLRAILAQAQAVAPTNATVLAVWFCGENWQTSEFRIKS